VRVSFGFSRGRLIVPPVHMRHKFQGRPDVVLDTGSHSTVITPRFAALLGFDAEEMEPTLTVTSATGAASAAELRVASVSVLDAEVRDLRVICHALPPALGLDGVLGLNFLQHFNETETVTLTRWRQ